MTLHVTNGDSTVMTLKELGIDALPWRDALHEGPVVPGRSDLRARAMGGDPAEFEARDRALADHDGDIVLWFEADLYDQLQIAEILSRLEGREVALRQIGEHVGIAHFGGLGELSARATGSDPRGPSERRSDRVRRPRLRRVDRARPRAGCSASARRASCASWPRPSPASPRSTRPPAAG